MKKIILVVVLGVCTFAMQAQITGGGKKGSSPAKSSGVKDYILKSGFFMEAALGGGSMKAKNASFNDPSLAMFGLSGKIGNRWVFGSNPQYRPGVQVIWGRLGVYDLSYAGSSATVITIAPVNVGFTNSIKLNDKMGVEVNLNLGLNTMILLDDFDSDAVSGFLINPEVRFRYKVFAVGFELARTSIEDANATTFSVVGGFRF